MSASEACLDAALAYAARGWEVFPVEGIDDRGRCTCRVRCASPGKHPHRVLGRDGGLHHATAETDRIRSWWVAAPLANVGTPTPLTIDLDGPDAVEAWGRLVSAHGPPSPDPGRPDGWTVRTGREAGGYHLHLRGDGLEGCRGKLAPGLEVRAPGRGYAVLPPSRHASGRRYAWLDPPVGEPPGLSSAWRDLLVPARIEPVAVPRATVELGGATGTRYGVAGLRELLADLAGSVEGTRHSTLYRVAVRVAELAAAGHLDVDDARRRVELAAEHVWAGADAREREVTVADGFARAGTA